VLTFSCARAVLTKIVLLSVVMLITVWTAAARADGIVLGGCVGSQGAVNCVVRWGEAGDPYIRVVPEPADKAERARSAERERKWEARCKPVIAQDGYGIPRYRFSAPGCEFGIID
jgi:hypothetical protein